MKQFDLYDILGVLAPGTILMLGLLHFYPERMAMFQGSSLSVGEFGAIILVAYIAGNLVAAIGNCLERPYRKKYGYPTDHARPDGGKIIIQKEFIAVEKKLRETKILEEPTPANDLSPFEWFAATRQIHSYLDTRSLTRRIEMFNAKFGMNRNLAVSFLLLLIISTAKFGLDRWRLDVVLLVCIVLALHRMNEFGFSYAQNLFRDFLTAPTHAKKSDAENDDE